MSMQPNQIPPVNYNSSGPEPQGNGKAVASLVLGILSIVMWLCPLVGFAVSITGLVLGSKARAENPSGMATAGFITSIVGLILTVINAGLGVMIALNGNL